jgi:NADPH-dependent ferric siderophore reductase
MTQPATTRIRYEAARRRELTVAEKRFLAPNYLSILFTCDDFGDFASASWDDHIKVFLAGDRAEGGRPPMRDYTPRSFDPVAGTFVIDFALHEDAGPATSWARDCNIGDKLAIGGPRGSVTVSTAFDWYWMIGDESAIPAISRHLAEQPDAAITVWITVASVAEEVPLPATVAHTIHWVHRPASQANAPAALLADLGQAQLPAGDGFVWIAAEAQVAKAARELVLSLGHPLSQMKAKGYWVAGASDSTASFD